MSAPRHGAEDPELLRAAVEAGHEVDHVVSRVVWRAAIAIVAVMLIGVVTVYLLQPLMVSDQERESPPANPLAATYGRLDPPAPRLQVDPALDIHDHRKAEARVLESYGWVDEQAGVVRIPIARAIELLAERGLPAPPSKGSAPGSAAPGDAAPADAAPAAGARP